jgi:hypothetical protein
MRALRIAVLVSCCCASMGATAQEDTLFLPFRALTIEDGLSQGMVSSIIQDRAGFMWFATKDGLNRYDGYSFRVFRHDPADSATVRDNYIKVIHEDRTGLLWVGTNSGLDVFDPTTEVFHHIPCDDGAAGQPAGKGDPRVADGVNTCEIRSIAEDPTGHLWVASGDRLYRIGPARNGTSSAGPTMRVDLVGIRPGDWSHWMAMDGSGQLRGPRNLTCPEPNVCALTVDTRDEARIAAMIADPQLLSRISVPAGQGEDDYAQFTTDTTRHLTHELGKAMLVTYDHVSDIRSAKALSARGWSYITRITTDVHGALWATDHRLFRCDPRTGRVTRLLPAAAELRIEALNVTCLYRDRNGVMWMGTNGFGVLRYDPRAERFHKQRSPSLRMMAPLRDGRMFAFTWLPWVHIFQEQGMTRRPIRIYGGEINLGAYEPCMVEEARFALSIRWYRCASPYTSQAIP